MIPYLVMVPLLAGYSAVTLTSMRRGHWNAQILVIETALTVVLVFIIFFSVLGVAAIEYPFLERRYAVGGEFLMRVNEHSSFGGSASLGGDATGEAALSEEFVAAVEGRRGEAIQAFDSFIQSFPENRRAPSAMFEKARLLNMRTAVERPDVAREIVLYTDMISPASEHIYLDIVERFPLSKEAARAHLALASLYCQSGAFEKAEEILEDAVNTYASRVPKDYFPVGSQRPRTVVGLIREERAKRRGRAVAAYDEAVRFAGKRLRFIRENRDYDGEPLRKFCELDTHAAGFKEKVEELMLLYPETVLKDNLLVAILPEEESARIGRLEEVAQDHPNGDAIDEVRYKLAQAYSISAEHRGFLRKAQGLLKGLIDEHPHSPFYWQAHRLLREIEEKLAEREALI
jgi:outer membrane protein assembly factor BamD (BamD/ComL family)